MFGRINWHRLLHWLTAKWVYSGGQAGVYDIERATCARCGAHWKREYNMMTDRDTGWTRLPDRAL